MKGEIVYLHRRRDDNSIFYVGRGSNRGRAYDEGRGRNKEWLEIVNDVYFDVFIVAHGLSKDYSCELEEFIIETIGLENLTNIVKGGLGTKGYKHTKETRDKISKAQKKIPTEARIKASNKGIKTKAIIRNTYYKHIETGQVTLSLKSACDKHNINYKAEHQRQVRNSFNKNFIKL
ncbi:hypothetical protein [uncultured Mediterranean phage uvMED]|nr:hypothetical protein [uncultured Mediterranean phage uvMED]